VCILDKWTHEAPAISLQSDLELGFLRKGDELGDEFTLHLR